MDRNSHFLAVGRSLRCETTEGHLGRSLLNQICDFILEGASTANSTKKVTLRALV